MVWTVVDVYKGGGVRLGRHVVCDGYAQGIPVRVQSHVHDDHMGGFNQSKGEQNLVMSVETRELLIAARNADLEYRDNLIGIPWKTRYELSDGSILRLVRSGHMLGACQVEVELCDGTRCGYSGDFAWPLEDVIKVDELVVDSTYGSPSSVRKYTQAEAEARLVELVCKRLRHGSVHIHGHRGTIERAVHILNPHVWVPMVGSAELIQELCIYQRYGFGGGTVLALGSEESSAAMKDTAYVRFYSKGDGFGNELPEGTSISCSAYMVRTDEPDIKSSDRSYTVGLSNHADFEGTLAYIEATGARRVVTDNTKTWGVELAAAIEQRLVGVEATASTNAELRH